MDTYIVNKLLQLTKINQNTGKLPKIDVLILQDQNVVSFEIFHLCTLLQTFWHRLFLPREDASAKKSFSLLNLSSLHFINLQT